MNTGHTHNEGDLYADDIHDAEFQDAEIIDEEIHDNPTAAQEASYAQEEPQVVEAQVQEGITLKPNLLKNKPKQKDKPAMQLRPMRLFLSWKQSYTRKRISSCASSLSSKTISDVLPKSDKSYSSQQDKMSYRLCSLS